MLDISSNRIGREGFRALGKGLAKCTTLQELCVSYNFITVSDTHNILASLLKVFTHLKALDVSHNN